MVFNCFQNKLKQTKSPSESDTESTSSTVRKASSGAPNLGDVLKGAVALFLNKMWLDVWGILILSFYPSDLGKVKLKSVERSPNGTPVRPPPNPAMPVDAASLIAAALKKRFNANYRYEKEGENECYNDDSGSIAFHCIMYIISVPLYKISYSVNVNWLLQYVPVSFPHQLLNIAPSDNLLLSEWILPRSPGEVGTEVGITMTLIPSTTRRRPPSRPNSALSRRRRWRHKRHHLSANTSLRRRKDWGGSWSNPKRNDPYTYMTNEKVPMTSRPPRNFLLTFYGPAGGGQRSTKVKLWK